jgi:predicted Rossmann fold nucleotide-binding protein DprA/Smf involved in DNA uptake
MKMKRLKRDLQSVIKNLKALTEKTEKIAKRFDAAEKVKAAPNRPVKAGKPAGKSAARKKAPATATDTVLSIIKRQKKGIDTAALKSKTDLDTKTIRNVIFRLKKQGKIQSTTRGVYMAA